MREENTSQPSGTENAQPMLPQSKARAEAWLNENRAAILAYNAWIAENGLPLGHFRQF